MPLHEAGANHHHAVTWITLPVNAVKRATCSTQELDRQILPDLPIDPACRQTLRHLSCRQQHQPKGTQRLSAQPNLTIWPTILIVSTLERRMHSHLTTNHECPSKVKCCFRMDTVLMAKMRHGSQKKTGIKLDRISCRPPEVELAHSRLHQMGIEAQRFLSSTRIRPTAVILV